jgi:hypothetical protein
VCLYLRASGKAGAAERFAGDPVFAARLSRLPEITERHPDIGRAVERASRTALQGGNLVQRSVTELTFQTIPSGVTVAG